MDKKSINQKQGPRVGNAGNAMKLQEFSNEKNARTSYFKQLADMVTDSLSSRGQQMKPGMPARDDYKALESISPNTRVRRGPQKGNK